MKNNKLRDFFKYRLPTFFRYTMWTPFRVIKNYFFCLKYPFYKCRNAFTDESCGYDFTWYDELPKGWRKAFGKKLSKELKKALKEDNQLHSFRFLQIKEKYGTLRMYNAGCSQKVEDIIEKYELLSMCYCINCGRPVRYCTHGYILYICENCYQEKIKHIREDISESDLQTIISDEKLKVDDIPKVTVYDGKTTEEVDILKTYGIDFYTMWGLER